MDMRHIPAAEEDRPWAATGTGSLARFASHGHVEASGLLSGLATGRRLIPPCG